MSNIHEECGVFGVFSPDNYDVARMTYYGLFSLQHRGQESCGIVVNDDGLFAAYKDVGLVNDVFTPERLDALGTGSIAVGHVRYGTTGSNDRNNAQPIVVNHVKGRMALAHNGNLVNSYELRSKLELEGSIFHTTSDTEVISYIITKERLTSGSIEEAVNRAMDKLKGAYSLAIMSPSKLIAARDEHGFRPLCYRQTADRTLRHCLRILRTRCLEGRPSFAMSSRARSSSLTSRACAASATTAKSSRSRCVYSSISTLPAPTL